jgi:arylsulfatase A-like enzyme
VPILFWRRDAAATPSNSAVETTDIMPTLAAMIGLPVTETIDGHCLAIEGVSCPSR